METMERSQADGRERCQCTQCRHREGAHAAEGHSPITVNFYGSKIKSPWTYRLPAWLRLWWMLLWSSGVYSVAPAQRRRLLDRYRVLTDIAFGGTFHVDITVGCFDWTWGPISGCTLKPIGCRPITPHTKIQVTLDSWQVGSAEWATTRNPSPILCMLWTIGFPFVRPQPTCSTMTAKFLGIKRRCRRPDDVLRAIQEGDLNGHRDSTGCRIDSDGGSECRRADGSAGQG